MPIQAPQKKRKLNEAIAGFKMHQRVKEEVPLEEAKRLYYEEELPLEEVAKHFDCGAPAVMKWFDDAGLPRRSQSVAARLSWKSRRQRHHVDLVELAGLRAEGLTYVQAANLYPCSAATLHNRKRGVH